MFSWILIAVCLGMFLFLNGRNKTMPNIVTSLKQRVRVGDVLVIILLSLIMICSFLLVQYASIDLFNFIGVDTGEDNTKISDFGQYFTCIIVLALFPAVMEELVFRGVVLQGLRNCGRMWAVLISAFLFSMYHMNAAQTIYQFIMGIIFAYVVILSGSLILSMILHFFNNFVVITYIYIVGPGGSYSWGVYTIITAVILALVGALFIWQILKILKKQNDSMWQKSDKRFVKIDTVAYAVCILVAGVLWTITLLM